MPLGGLLCGRAPFGGQHLARMAHDSHDLQGLSGANGGVEA